ncbi:MAG: hypothetical protein ACTTH7_01375 [Treponema sp.]
MEECYITAKLRLSYSIERFKTQQAAVCSIILSMRRLFLSE